MLEPLLAWGVSDFVIPMFMILIDGVCPFWHRVSAHPPPQSNLRLLLILILDLPHLSVNWTFRSTIEPQEERDSTASIARFVCLALYLCRCGFDVFDVIQRAFQHFLRYNVAMFGRLWSLLVAVPIAWARLRGRGRERKFSKFSKYKLAVMLTSSWFNLMVEIHSHDTPRIRGPHQ